MRVRAAARRSPIASRTSYQTCKDESLRHRRSVSMGREKRYIHEPPFSKFLDGVGEIDNIVGGARARIFGDSVTTDHISPRAQSKRLHLPANILKSRGIRPEDFTVRLSARE